jgi:hypothetical protein
MQEPANVRLSLGGRSSNLRASAEALEIPQLTAAGLNVSANEIDVSGMYQFSMRVEQNNSRLFESRTNGVQAARTRV